MKAITKRNLVSSLIAGALAVSCIGFTGCGSNGSNEASESTEQSETTEVAETASEDSYVSQVTGVHADWNTPGYYEYQNDDPSCPFQNFLVIVNAKDGMNDLLNSVGQKSKFFLNISPYLNPEIYKVYEDTNAGIYNEDKVIDGDLNFYINRNLSEEKQAEIKEDLYAKYGKEDLSDAIKSMGDEEVMNLLIEEHLAFMQYDAKTMVSNKTDTDNMYTYFTIEFPITSLDDLTHLTLSTAFCFDDDRELSEAFAMDFRGRESEFAKYDIDIDEYYLAPIHFTCIGFTPLDIPEPDYDSWTKHQDLDSIIAEKAKAEGKL